MTLPEKARVQRRVMNLHYPWTPVDSSIYLSDSHLPTHSALFGAWVSAGILGVVPWLVIAGVTMRWFRRITPAAAGSLYPVLALLAVLQIWNMLFSPFGGSARGLMAVAFAAHQFFVSHDWHHSVGEPNRPSLGRSL